MKKLLWVGGVLLLVVAGGSYWLYSSLDSIAKQAIETIGSEVLQTRVRVDRVQISPTDGKAALHGLHVGNPKGFSPADAFAAGKIEVGISPSSLTTDVIRVTLIEVIAPQVTYESGDNGNNLDGLKRNAETATGAGQKSAPEKQKASDPGKKLIIDRLVIRSAKLTYSSSLTMGKPLDLTLPDIVLNDIGKARGGVTGGELAKEVLGALTKQAARSVADSAGSAVKSLGKSAGKLFGTK